MHQKQLDYMNHSRNAILKQYFYKMHLALKSDADNAMYGLLKKHLYFKSVGILTKEFFGDTCCNFCLTAVGCINNPLFIACSLDILLSNGE